MEKNIIIAEGDQVNGQDIILLSNPARKRTIESITDNEAVLCKTRQEAGEFCKLLHAAGKKWSDGDTYDKVTRSDRHPGCLCYSARGRYGERADYESMDYTISYATEFLEEEPESEEPEKVNGPTIYDMVKEIHQKIMISPSSVPYQLCPMCNGLKYVPGMSTAINQQCGICSGKGIIPQHII